MTAPMQAARPFSPQRDRQGPALPLRNAPRRVGLKKTGRRLVREPPAGGPARGRYLVLPTAKLARRPGPSCPGMSAFTGPPAEPPVNAGRFCRRGCRGPTIAKRRRLPPAPVAPRRSTSVCAQVQRRQDRGAVGPLHIPVPSGSLPTAFSTESFLRSRRLERSPAVRSLVDLDYVPSTIRFEVQYSFLPYQPAQVPPAASPRVRHRFPSMGVLCRPTSRQIRWPVPSAESASAWDHIAGETAGRVAPPSAQAAPPFFSRQSHPR